MNDCALHPSLVVWELTRACALACGHCRTASQPQRDPCELTATEALKLLEQIVRAQPQLVIFTGGDPAMRPDYKELIRHAARQGLRVSLSPSATPRLLAEDFGALKRLGLARIALSLDGASPGTHNAFRGAAQSWAWTMQAAEKACAAALPLQINTVFTRQNLSEFDAFADVLHKLNPAAWNVFLFVPAGRGTADQMPGSAAAEDLFERLYELSRLVPFPVKVTEGPHYRRVVRRHEPDANIAAVNDGKGFVLVTHTGEIRPGGFLPFAAGSVRTDELLDVYRRHELFVQLRDSSRLKGRCGRCEFKDLCGGSRGRAWAVTGDAFAEDPCCGHEPGAV